MSEVNIRVDAVLDMVKALGFVCDSSVRRAIYTNNVKDLIDAMAAQVRPQTVQIEAPDPVRLKLIAFLEKLGIEYEPTDGGRWICRGTPVKGGAISMAADVPTEAAAVEHCLYYASVKLTTEGRNEALKSSLYEILKDSYIPDHK